MSQIVGLIEIETGGTAVTELAAPCDDATLDELFARLVTGDATEGETDEPAASIELTADLDLLSDDLSQVTRRLLQEIFMTRSSGRENRLPL